MIAFYNNNFKKLKATFFFQLIQLQFIYKNVFKARLSFLYIFFVTIYYLIVLLKFFFQNL